MTNATNVSIEVLVTELVDGLETGAAKDRPMITVGYLMAMIKGLPDSLNLTQKQMNELQKMLRWHIQYNS